MQRNGKVFLEKLVKQRFRSSAPWIKNSQKFIMSGESEVHFIKRTKNRAGLVLKVFNPGVHAELRKARVGLIVKGYADELNKMAQHSIKMTNYYNEKLDLMRRYWKKELRKGEQFDPYTDPEKGMRELSKSKGYIPFVSQIRSPKIIAEETLRDGQHTILMEEIHGPTLGELTQAAHGGLSDNPRHQFVKAFLEKRKVAPEILKETISKTINGITSSSREWAQHDALGFRFEEDAFIAEDIDSHGNLKLVLVDFR